jgi:asparagine synthase (glutamine-hydrolysing)
MLRLGAPPPLIVSEVRESGLTYLGIKALEELHDCVRRIEARGPPGILVEAGCALGGSAIVIARAKSPGRPLHVFDAFGMIHLHPMPTESTPTSAIAS